MRANIPQSPRGGKNISPRHSAMELQGIYLHAMEDISSRLMEALPAEDTLWQTLAKTESLLIEAQLAGASLHDVFGGGGVAAFCQSIVDEYNQERAGQPRDIPAAEDRSLRHAKKPHEPRGGINYYRKRRATTALIVAFSCLFMVLALWYSGLLHFFIKGSGYYLDELYHFSSTITPVSDSTITFTLPLAPATDINHPLYADENGNTLMLTELSYTERLHRIEQESISDANASIYQENLVWCIHIRYPVDVGYLKVRYTEPANSGHAVLTLADGTVISSTIATHRTGTDGQGYEYVMLEVSDIAKSTNMNGAILTVTLDPPQRVVWKRIGVGFRSKKINICEV